MSFSFELAAIPPEEVDVCFDPKDGRLYTSLSSVKLSRIIPKDVAINLASKLLEWGTSR